MQALCDTSIPRPGGCSHNRNGRGSQIGTIEPTRSCVAALGAGAGASANGCPEQVNLQARGTVALNIMMLEIYSKAGLTPGRGGLACAWADAFGGRAALISL